MGTIPIAFVVFWSIVLGIALFIVLAVLFFDYRYLLKELDDLAYELKLTKIQLERRTQHEVLQNASRSKSTPVVTINEIDSLGTDYLVSLLVAISNELQERKPDAQR